MIDTILHSVEEAEEKADQTLREARAQVQRIGEEAAADVEEFRRKQKELFEADASSRRALVREEECRKDEEAEAAVKSEIEMLKKNAKEKEEQIVRQLAAQII